MRQNTPYPLEGGSFLCPCLRKKGEIEIACDLMSHLDPRSPPVVGGQEGDKSLELSTLGRGLSDLPELAASLLLWKSEPGRFLMLQSIRRAVAFPQVPVQALAAVVSVLAFGWLLVNDLVQPIVILLLELFLTF